MLAHRRHVGPLRVQRPFYPERDVCHAYPIHPPGGVVGGDVLELEVGCAAGGFALLTTPAAAKFYRSAGQLAVQRQRLTIADGASLEWLPQEQIVFDGAALDTLTQVQLAAKARFIGWELTCLGRPAGNARFAHGMIRQRLEIWRDGRPLLLERLRLSGESSVLSASWGLRGHSVIGTLVASGADDACVEATRGALAADDPVAVTRLDDLLVARYRGDSAEQARALFIRTWAVLRPRLLDRAACEPRIWST